MSCADPAATLHVLYNDGSGSCGPPPARAPGCYWTPSDREPIPGCECYEACSKCGYYPPKGVVPNSPEWFKRQILVDFDDCVTCASGKPVSPIFVDGTGTCDGRGELTQPGCYTGIGDDQAPIPNCQCHSSCSLCGFGTDPTAADDCLKCADPSHEHTVVYGDGTGTCGPRSAAAGAQGGEAQQKVALSDIKGARHRLPASAKEFRRRQAQLQPGGFLILMVPAVAFAMVRVARRSRTRTEQEPEYLCIDS